MTFARFSTLAFVAVGGALSTLCAAAGGAEVNTAGPLSLDAAVQIALRNNPELRAAAGRLDAASGRARQAAAWGNPELELGAEDWRVRPNRGMGDAKRTIGVVQPIPFPGKRALDTQVGRAGVKISEAELMLRETDVVRDVKIAFSRVLAGERLAEISSELVATAESAATTATRRVDAGAAAYHEQLRAEVLLEQARSDLADAESEVASARQGLAAVLGRSDMTQVKLTGSLDEAGVPGLLARAESTRGASHPSVDAARFNLERAELSRRRARLDPYSDVRVGLAGGRSGETDQSIIQLSLSVPLPILNRGKGLQQEARANVTVAQAELEAARQQFERERADAARRYRKSIDQVTQSRDRILPKAAEALRLVQTGFATGKFGFIDLIDTQRTAAEVRKAHYVKVQELNIARAELEALLDATGPAARTNTGGATLQR